MSFVDDCLSAALEIDSTDALRKKLIVMFFMAVGFILGRSFMNMIKWNLVDVSCSEPCRTTTSKMAKFPYFFLKLFLLAGALLFKGMAGEMFSIPLDLITSFLDDGLTIVLRTAHHAFLSEYMVNLTLSGLHVWNCLRLLGPRINTLSGQVGIRVLNKFVHLSDNECDVLMSSKGATSHFDIRALTLQPGFFPPKAVIRIYFILLLKMLVFAALARVVAFSMLWVSTFVTIFIEPLFFVSDLLLGACYLWGGSLAVSTVAILWSVVTGIFLGDKQTTSGSDEPNENGYLFSVYNTVFEVTTAPLSKMIIAETKLSSSYQELQEDLPGPEAP